MQETFKATGMVWDRLPRKEEWQGKGLHVQRVPGKLDNSCLGEKRHFHYLVKNAVGISCQVVNFSPPCQRTQQPGMTPHNALNMFWNSKHKSKEHKEARHTTLLQDSALDNESEMPKHLFQSLRCPSHCFLTETEMQGIFLKKGHPGKREAPKHEFPAQASAILTVLFSLVSFIKY